MNRPSPEPRSAFPHFERLELRWADNDIYGHVNNAYHYQLFDTAVNGWLLRQGILDFGRSETVWLVVSSGCDYFGEIAFPDVIHAGLRIGRLGGSSVRWEIGLFRNDAEDCAALGHFVHVNVGREDRRPKPIAEDARSLLVPLIRQSAA